MKRVEFAVFTWPQTADEWQLGIGIVTVFVLAGVVIGFCSRGRPIPPPATDSRGTTRSGEMPLRYIMAAILILALFLGATVLPDLLRYCAPQPASATSGTALTSPSGPLTPAAASLAQTAMNPTAATAQLFESYARLVTLFLGVASVLAVFFGYFVRKSIRETEEDVDKRFDRNMEQWEKERTALKEAYEKDQKTLQEHIKIAKELEERQRSQIDELGDALSRTRPSAAASGPSVLDTAAQVDAALGGTL